MAWVAGFGVTAASGGCITSATNGSSRTSRKGGRGLFSRGPSGLCLGSMLAKLANTCEKQVATMFTGFLVSGNTCEK